MKASNNFYLNLIERCLVVFFSPSHSAISNSIFAVIFRGRSPRKIIQGIIESSIHSMQRPHSPWARRDEGTQNKGRNFPRILMVINTQTHVSIIKSVFACKCSSKSVHYGGIAKVFRFIGVYIPQLIGEVMLKSRYRLNHIICKLFLIWSQLLGRGRPLLRSLSTLRKWLHTQRRVISFSRLLQIRNSLFRRSSECESKSTGRTLEGASSFSSHRPSPALPTHQIYGVWVPSVIDPSYVIHFCFSRNVSMARRTISATLRSSFFDNFLSATICGSVR